MLIVDKAEFKKMCEYYRQINKVPLEEIQWIDNGKPIVIDPEVFKEWEYVCLNNKTFGEEVILKTDVLEITALPEYKEE